MPKNKNALTRYKYLDEMLSDRHHFYSIRDLTEKCNRLLTTAGLPEVTRRCIEKDINYLEYDPFFADIERFNVNGKHCLRYASPSFSIFKKELSVEERNLIYELLSTIGQFDGLAHFEWLERFRQGLSIEQRPKIISFDYNPYLQNSALLGVLFDNISCQVVVRLEYHTFSDQERRTVVFHPYLLKQYNNRWYVIGAADDGDKLLSFALDRIDDVVPLPDAKYRVCGEDLSSRFEDVVGITLYEDRPIERIVFWCRGLSSSYITTKPIHGSQRILNKQESDKLRSQYPCCAEDGIFVSLDCIPNYELIRELCSFGKDLVVLSPLAIREKIWLRISGMLERYSEVRI